MTLGQGQVKVTVWELLRDMHITVIALLHKVTKITIFGYNMHIFFYELKPKMEYLIEPMR